MSSARLITRNSSHADAPFPKPAELQLTCFKEQPIVRLAFQMKVGSGRNSQLGYRFDDNPGREPDARFLNDRQTVVIEDQKEVAQFIRQLSTAKVLFVRIRSLNTGRTAAEFQLAGAATAIEASLANCPVGRDPARPRRAPSASRPSA